jgi:site-specific recombinase XerD
MDTQTLPELLTKYLQHCLIIRNYSKVTITSYNSSFKLFFRETGALHPKDLTKELLEGWFYNGRLNRKWSAGTFRDHIKHLNPFIKWLIKENYLTTNNLDGLEKPRIEQRIPRTLSKEESQLVLDASFHIRYQYKLEKYRNRALIGIMLLAGLRRKEVINLKLNDIDLVNRTIFINQGKWYKDRLVAINSRLHTILYEYLKERDRHDRLSIYFFIGVQKNRPIGESCMKKLIDRLRKVTKLNFSAHTLRHAFARLMLEGGCDIYTLSKLMGHAKITTTTIYLTCSNQQMGKSIEMHSLN